jgi:hypothetical protein
VKHGPQLTGEKSNHKVAGIFPDRAAAQGAADALRNTLPLEKNTQLVVLHPGDAADRALEPEQGGIFRTIIRAHVWLGLGGAVVGAAVFVLVYVLGVRMVVQSPVTAALVIIGFATVAGLMLGGLVSLRPDHDPYIQRVRGALTEGRSAVVFHGFDREERDAAATELRRLGGETVTTL